MRFSTRDLMMMTALAAAYAAMAAAGLFGNADMMLAVFPYGVGMTVTFALLQSLILPYPPRDAGTKLCDLIPQRPWFEQFGIAAITLGAGIAYQSIGQDPPRTVLPAFLPFIVVMAAANTWFTRPGLYVNGLVVGRKLLRFGAHCYELRETRNGHQVLINGRPRPSPIAPPLPLVPKERIDEVSAILASQQGPGEETTDEQG